MVIAGVVVVGAPVVVVVIGGGVVGGRVVVVVGAAVVVGRVVVVVGAAVVVVVRGMVKVAELLPGTGSGWSLLVIVAVTDAGALETCAMICKVADAPAASVPTLHRPLFALYEPMVAAEET